MTSTTSFSRSLIAAIGFGYFPLAFIARLPFAMMVVGVLALVVNSRGSIATGGLASAAVGIGVVAAAPVVGDLVDRFGQRRILVPIGLANGLLLGAFPLVAYSGMPDALVLVAAALIGLTGPQVAPMSRARVIGVIGRRIQPETRSRTVSRTMAYESAADETAFVIGPFVVGIVAAALAPWAPLAVAAAISLVFVTAFALHPSGTVAAPSGPKVELAPRSELVKPRILVLLVAVFGVGAFFGATLTSLTAFMEAEGDASRGALLYGVMGIGSAVFALAMALVPERFAMQRRLLLFAALLTASSTAYAFAGSVAAITFVLSIMGIGIGPALVTIFSIAAARSPQGRSASVMTLLSSSLMLAQALTSALVGSIAENISIEVAMMVPGIAGALVLAMAVVNVVLTARERRADTVADVVHRDHAGRN